MTDAERSLREAVQAVSAEVHKLFDTNEELSDKDREIILEIAQKALAIFQHTS
jgi:F-type H+-transporting ATPase subunit alpha